MSAPSSAALSSRLSHLCDRCGAPAKFQALIPKIGELLFCGHHFHQHGRALADEFLVVPVENVP